MNLLELQDIHVHYGGVKALDGVSVTVGNGEIVALMGPNGAGKSTVLKTIFGLTPLSQGRVLWKGQGVIPVSYEIVKMGISFVPQGRRVFAHLTVEENLEIAGFVVRDKAELKRRCEQVMETFPALKAKRRSKSGTLSGGQQQMLALARGLVTNPQLLLLDEPSLGLAPKLVKEIFAQIKIINQKYNTAIVVVEHNIKSLFEFVDRAYVLDKGRVVVEGTSQKLLSGDILERVFLGRPV